MPKKYRNSSTERIHANAPLRDEVGKLLLSLNEFRNKQL